MRVNELEEILGVPVVPISAAKNEGIEELIDHAIHAARHREVPGRVDFCPASSDEHDPVGAVHRCIHAAIHTKQNSLCRKFLLSIIPKQLNMELQAAKAVQSPTLSGTTRLITFYSKPPYEITDKQKH